ncbi:DUF5050 domain-containing protein [Viridibacillus sp. YIM B01967]|uniref:DUF5050 domain-containing protein n=1 Tax=Viridibacillus soli TaxID=2798301 RepID=A0ABS1H1N9_9BACL|nr:transglutaminase domain-containing protein [Viridibacillus soli]MBK3493294.1 DUF5050 domain-containing protein [Viridibacillus soli]
MRKASWYLSIFSLALMFILTSASHEGMDVSAASKPVNVSSVKGLKTILSKAMHNYDRELTVTYKGNIDPKLKQINGIVEQVLAEDDYLAGSFRESKSHFRYTSSSATLTYTFSYHTTNKQEQYVNAEVKKIIKKEISNKMSDYEKVKAINDYIVLNTKYGADTKASAHSAFAVFKEGKGVCQGYTLAAYKLYKAAGIDVQYVVGNVDQVAHSWNLVKVEGKWYHVDSTFNDPTPDRAGVVSYKYFLLSDSALAEDHYWMKKDYKKATAKTYDFIRNAQDFEQDEKLFYYTNKTDHSAIYKRNIKNNTEVKLADTTAKYLVKAGDWLYFNNDDQYGYLTRIHTNGTQQEQLNKQYSSDLKVKDNKLYYLVDDEEQILNLVEVVAVSSNEGFWHRFFFMKYFSPS